MKVAISVPTHNEVKSWFAYDLAHLVGYFCCNPWKGDTEIMLNFTSSSILPQARHELVTHALASGATHMLWLDSDMRFPKETLNMLLAHDKDIVAANYTTRRLPVIPVTQAMDRSRINSLGKTGLEEVFHTGLGLCLTKIEVLRKMEPPYFMFGYLPTGKYVDDGAHVAKGKFVGEDVYFLHKARGLGFKVFIDHDLSNQVAHIGEYEYDMGTLPEWVHESSGDHRAGAGNGQSADPRPNGGDLGAGLGLAGDRPRPAV